MSGSEFPVISSICATFGGVWGRCPTERQKILDLLFRSSRDTAGTIKRGSNRGLRTCRSLAHPTVSATEERRFAKELAEYKMKGIPGEKEVPFWFMELVLNALYWLKKQRPRSRGKK